MPFHSIFVHMKPPYSLQTSRSGHRNGGCRSRRHGCLHPVRSGRQRGRRDTLHKPASMRPLVKAGWGMWVLRFVCVKCKWCKQHWFIVASQLLHIHSCFTSVTSQPCCVWPLSCHDHKQKGTLGKIRRVHRHTTVYARIWTSDILRAHSTLLVTKRHVGLVTAKFNCALNVSTGALNWNDLSCKITEE